MKKATYTMISIAILAFSGLMIADEAKAINNPPYWQQISGKTVSVGERVIFDVEAEDPDGNLLDYDALNLPAGAFFGSSGISYFFSWTPISNQGGTHYVTFRVSDGLSTSDMTVPITVLGGQNQSTNVHPPVYQNPPQYYPPYSSTPTFIGFNPPLVAVEGELYSYTVYATGNSGYQTMYRLTTAPSGMLINSTTGLITWVPTSTQGRATPYRVTVEATNGGLSAIQSYDLTVLDMNGGTGSSYAAPQTSAPQPTLSISDVKLSVAENGDVEITWKTNLAATARVIYDTESQATKTKDFTYALATDETTDRATSHAVTIRDMKPDTTYYFRAVAKRNGSVATSDEMTVSTSASNETASVLASLGAFLTSPWFLLPILLIISFLYFRARKSQHAM
jgi:hypothetical protein